MVQFEPETRHYDDLPDPILRILNAQHTSDFIASQSSTIKMSNFIDAVCKQSSFMPLSVRSLEPAKLTQLISLCKSLSEITAIFCSVNRISHTYRDKDGYVLKRLYQMS